MPQRLRVDSAKIAWLVKYNAFGEGKHVVLMVDEALYACGKQKMNMIIVSSLSSFKVSKLFAVLASQGLLYAC